ncbi:putative PilT protein domain protein [Sterolibacterium denitrificans]|uniref:PilT protein domain protein n=1 Tax=Sterolibacterium denitrificans TaxID=157592 RepID=A0A7Z7MU52_9PROT|nr:type II toxin-antitoxin system VapC family toxin [Sterolibacterium denitrificans]SMB21802.1 putative PilT protein domain protein [Sterolibacterium denitrificans]
MNFVLDNSVVMRWYFGGGATVDLEYASRVLDSMTSAGVLVPGVWSLEVANVLARAEAKGLTTEARTETFIGMLNRMDISIDGATSVQALSSILQLARRYNLSSYDASYLELAMREDLPLATLDDDLRRAAKRAGVAQFLGN